MALLTPIAFYFGNRHALDADLAEGLLDLRAVVRANSKENLQRDLEKLYEYPMLDGLHPGLRDRLEVLRDGKDNAPVYALPYSVHWAPRILKVYDLLHEAAVAVAGDDPDFADYLALRARDLVSDNYEAGDAAYLDNDYRTAGEKYREAVDVIEPLIEEVNDVFARSMSEANAAFEAGDNIEALR